jgi:CBS domain-containing protein
MKLKDVMTTQVEVVRPEASIQEAAEKMRTLDVGALPVCDGQQLKGMVPTRTSPSGPPPRGATLKPRPCATS